MKTVLALILSLIYTLSSQAASYEIRPKIDRTPIFARATEASQALSENNIKAIAELGDKNIQNTYFISEIDGVYKVSFLNKEKGSTNIGFVHSNLAHKVMIGVKKLIRTPRNANQKAIFFKPELMTSLRERFSLNTITELKTFLAELPQTISDFEKQVAEKEGLILKHTATIKQQNQALHKSQESLSKLTQTKNELDQNFLASLDKNSQLKTDKETLELDQTEKVKKINELRTKITNLKEKNIKELDEAQKILYISAIAALILGFILSLFIRR